MASWSWCFSPVDLHVAEQQVGADADRAPVLVHGAVFLRGASGVAVDDDAVTCLERGQQLRAGLFFLPGEVRPYVLVLDRAAVAGFVAGLTSLNPMEFSPGDVRTIPLSPMVCSAFLLSTISPHPERLGSSAIGGGY